MYMPVRLEQMTDYIRKHCGEDRDIRLMRTGINSLVSQVPDRSCFVSLSRFGSFFITLQDPPINPTVPILSRDLGGLGLERLGSLQMV
uniref:RNA-directed RNA polymerase n=1 Tax=Bursaphelenchus xylophilus TaxID=6326 RepID=A0A1I7SU96_BURXY